MCMYLLPLPVCTTFTCISWVLSIILYIHVHTLYIPYTYMYINLDDIDVSFSRVVRADTFLSEGCNLFVLVKFYIESILFDPGQI